MKSNERILAEKIQSIVGGSLVSINRDAYEFVAMGMFSTRLAALEYMLEVA